MKIGSLCSGIGGIELGLQRAFPDARVAWQVEIDPFCRRILARHFPQTSRTVTDVKNASARNLEVVDLICAGFPCQDLSVAGTGAGLAGQRSGLWQDVYRIVGELKPQTVVIENVAHGRGRWLPYVRSDLETIGYRTAAYVLGAGDFGAPHERRRCFVVAYANRKPLRNVAERVPRGRARGLRGQGEGKHVDDGASWHPTGASAWRSFPRIHGMDDGLSAGMDAARLKAIGNAVSPQVAEAIGRIIAHDLANPDAKP